MQADELNMMKLRARLLRAFFYKGEIGNET